MQLKLSRSQRDGGLVSTTAIFCLDARVQLSAQEDADISRYRLGRKTIYNSEASKRQLAKASVEMDGSLAGSLKGLAYMGLSRLNLNITVNSLRKGQHIECRDLDELLGAEAAIMTACENLKGYLDTAATFDGREIVFDFATGVPPVASGSSAPMPRVADVLPLPAASAPHHDRDLILPEPALAAAFNREPGYSSYASSNGEFFREITDWFSARSIGQRAMMLGGGAIVLLYLVSHL